MQRLTRRQSDLLNTAAERLKPHGRICYSTCSIQKTENGERVGDFLRKSPAFELESEELILPSAERFDHDGGYTAILILLNVDWFRSTVFPTMSGNSLVDMDVFLPAMVWGGIGGVAAVFYSLFKHVGRRDFDSQYNLSYVGKPFLGVILGATVYMIIHLMIMTLGILPAGLEGGGRGAGHTHHCALDHLPGRLGLRLQGEPHL